MVEGSVAGSLSEEVDDSAPEFRTAMMIVSTLFVPMSPAAMAEWTGYSEKECLHVFRIMTDNDIWTANGQDFERHMKGDDKPGIQQGDLELVLEMLLCLGTVKRTSDGRWHCARAAMLRERDQPPSEPQPTL